eukprot:533520-Pyramimonas_sp.AAC.1
MSHIPEAWPGGARGCNTPGAPRVNPLLGPPRSMKKLQEGPPERFATTVAQATSLHSARWLRRAPRKVYTGTAGRLHLAAQ